MRILFGIVLTILFSINAYALKEDMISKSMKEYIDKSVSILEQKDITIEQKAKNIFTLLDHVFDYTLMARLSLANEWKKLTQQEQDEFIKIFEKALKESYISKLELYNNQKISVKNLEKLNNTRIKLLTQIQNASETYDIIYKFYSTKEQDWLIYDVDIAGVSIIQTYRVQFADILKNDSFKTLLEKLKTTHR